MSDYPQSTPHHVTTTTTTTTSTTNNPDSDAIGPDVPTNMNASSDVPATSTAADNAESVTRNEDGSGKMDYQGWNPLAGTPATEALDQDKEHYSDHRGSMSQNAPGKLGSVGENVLAAFGYGGSTVTRPKEDQGLGEKIVQFMGVDT